jgi:hypothetical protein
LANPCPPQHGHQLSVRPSAGALPVSVSISPRVFEGDGKGDACAPLGRSLPGLSKQIWALAVVEQRAVEAPTEYFGQEFQHYKIDLGKVVGDKRWDKKFAAEDIDFREVNNEDHQITEYPEGQRRNC